MKMTNADSSHIKAHGFDPSTGLLTLHFHSGDKYQYGRVSQMQYEAMCNADSMGQWFHRNLRNNANHPVMKVGDEP